MWVRQDDDTRLPIWLKNALPNKCKYCGSPMEDYYNDSMQCTNRRCSNDKCVGFMAAKADTMRNLLGIKGIGFAKCLSDIRSSGVTSHVQLLPYWNCKPKVTIDIFMRMHCFPGVDNEWETVVKRNRISTLDQLYSHCSDKLKAILDEHMDEIKQNLSYVELINPFTEKTYKEPKHVITIMITGTPNGYESKEDFINKVNAALPLGNIVVIHQKTKRQTGVDFLIREPGSTTRGKVEAAMKGGIPIVTSEQFIQYLIALTIKDQGGDIPKTNDV